MSHEAIIIKKVPIREFDELIICYTKDNGKQTYQIKSSLRHTSKQGRHVDVLSHADFNLVEGHVMPIIVSARCLNPFYNIKSSLKSWALATFILECVDKIVPENEPDTDFWFRLHDILNDCITHDMSVDRLRDKTLGFLGYPASANIEDIAQSKFNSLDFIRRLEVL